MITHAELTTVRGIPAPDLIAIQRRTPGSVTRRAAHRPSAQRLTRPAAPLPTGLCRMPHTINSPISPKNLTRDIAVNLVPSTRSGTRAAGQGSEVSTITGIPQL
jgi:hypothetical protein